MLSGIIAFTFPVYSDEFAQDLHLFPFSPVRIQIFPTPAILDKYSYGKAALIIYHIQEKNANSFVGDGRTTEGAGYWRAGVTNSAV